LSPIEGFETTSMIVWNVHSAQALSLREGRYIKTILLTVQALIRHNQSGDNPNN
jgi:hypothetical protein